jgi:hypothetical protein
MNARFQHLLDVNGPDFARWPAHLRDDAERLLAADPAARALWERARRFDALVTRLFETTSEQEAVEEQIATTRILGELAQLPVQKRRTWWAELSGALLDWDFRPAWPRIAALASVAVLGFAIGLVELDVSSSEVPRSLAVAEPDVGGIVFEPEPLTGSRP